MDSSRAQIPWEEHGAQTVIRLWLLRSHLGLVVDLLDSISSEWYCRRYRSNGPCTSGDGVYQLAFYWRQWADYRLYPIQKIPDGRGRAGKGKESFPRLLPISLIGLQCHTYWMKRPVRHYNELFKYNQTRHPSQYKRHNILKHLARLFSDRWINLNQNFLA